MVPCSPTTSPQNKCEIFEGMSTSWAADLQHVPVQGREAAIFHNPWSPQGPSESWDLNAQGPKVVGKTWEGRELQRYNDTKLHPTKMDVIQLE